MSKFQFSYDADRQQNVAQFQAKLLDVSQETVGQFPSGKYYRVGTLEFENNAGQKVQRSCIINEANYSKGMTAGNTYLTSAIVKDGSQTILLVCSHLVGSTRASMDDFGFGDMSAVKTGATPVINANPLVLA
jgi:hypothetical protein